MDQAAQLLGIACLGGGTLLQNTQPEALLWKAHPHPLPAASLSPQVDGGIQVKKGLISKAKVKSSGPLAL